MKLKSYFAFAAQTWMLATTFVLTLVFVLGVFPFLPVGGELLDYKPSYSHEEAMAAMEEYGKPGSASLRLGEPHARHVVPSRLRQFLRRAHLSMPSHGAFLVAGVRAGGGRNRGSGRERADHTDADSVSRRFARAGGGRFGIHSVEGSGRAGLSVHGAGAARPGVRALARAAKPAKFVRRQLATQSS